jgi:hypothetical protein
MPEKKRDLQPYENASKRSFKDTVFYNFVGGLSWALGATIGLSLIIWSLTMLAKNVNFVPIVGGFVSHIIDFILATNPNLHK